MTSDRARRRSLLSQPWRPRLRRVAAPRRVLLSVLIGLVAAGLPSPVIASSGGGRRITDAENTRTVYLVVGALVLLAIGLGVFTWWFWRSTRRDHEALAPLEVMTDRKFLASDALARRVMLDGHRPIGAAPLAPGAPEPLIAQGVVFGDAEPANDAPTTVVVATADAAPSESVAEESAEAGPSTPPNQIVKEDAPESPIGESDRDTTATGATTEVLPTVADASAGPEHQQSDSADAAAIGAPIVRADGSRQASTPIDPGLPVLPVDEEPVRPLSLAELAALQSDVPLGFDDGELASTPSTGIPVIESAEAWVQRQLAASKEAPESVGDDAGPLEDDVDETAAAATRGAD